MDDFDRTTKIGGAAQETHRMVEMIRSDIEKALSEHSATAVGRLHQTLVQLLESGGGMLGLPAVFTQAIAVFIRAKVSRCPIVSVK